MQLRSPDVRFTGFSADVNHPAWHEQLVTNRLPAGDDAPVGHAAHAEAPARLE